MSEVSEVSEVCAGSLRGVEVAASCLCSLLPTPYSLLPTPFAIQVCYQ
ncbi:MAG: hypothetical protein F6K50_23765 [Moorea sp. SIO3I7]|nr:MULTISPECIES: hypothetical protein [unclassified Moorena]NEN98418.1 hypothetical protein [Moorena sp. SIO3I7]NEO21126.1 hypothetical protein [Moorena sp. SIO4A5]NEO06114.1 hypothetical protein [Moorena sp. SIO3I8]NEP23817.1 hypothetical protein [Moorena sp. SIO3I6]NEQ59658.1 hypothetical protein [Moorena sp. SIO4A1]